MSVYEDGAYCYACAYRDNNINLSAFPQHRRVQTSYADLTAETMRIQLLPMAPIRGLSLPVDETGYYLLWPEKTYYVKRFYKGEPKYKGPSGIPRPVFRACHSGSDKCIIVEGEFNALSLTMACSGIDIFSPGGANQFCVGASKEFLPIYCLYDSILLIADDDEAGANGIQSFKKLLEARGKKPKAVLMSRDANDILVNDGKEELKKTIEEALGMFGGVQSGKDTLCTS